MSENGDDNQSQGYCTSCGAQVRSGTAFCVSCGAQLKAGSDAPDHMNAGATPPRAVSLGSEGRFESFTRRAKALPKPSGVVVVLMALGLVMVMLLALFPLISPLLEFAGQGILLVPLFVFAVSVFGVLLEVGGVERRRLLKRLGLITLSVYFFFATYHVLLDVLGILEGGSPAWLLVLVVGSGLVYVAFVIRNRGENAMPVSPVLTGENWLATLGNVFRWVKSLPSAVKVAVVVGVLGALILFSPYVFVSGAALVGAGALALIVRTVQRMPLKQAGTITLASLALTLVFGSISDSLYHTGTGLEVSINRGGADYARDAVTKPSGYSRLEPELQELADSWPSSGSNDPLFLPTHLPFPLAEVWTNPTGGPYEIRGEERGGGDDPAYLEIQQGYSVPYNSWFPSWSPSPEPSIVVINGEPYYYADLSEVDPLGRPNYRVVFWKQSDEDLAVDGRPVQTLSMNEINHYSDPDYAVPSHEEFIRMFESVVRIDP